MTCPKASVSHLQAGHRKGIYLEDLVRLDNPVSSSILHPFASWCASKSITNISAPPFLECIDYVNIQTVPPEIPTWRSCVRTNITHQRAGKGKRLLGEEAHKDSTILVTTQCHVSSLQLQVSRPEKTLLTVCTFSFSHGMRKCYGPPLNLWREKNLHERKDRTHNTKMECDASQLPHAGTFLFPFDSKGIAHTLLSLSLLVITFCIFKTRYHKYLPLCLEKRSKQTCSLLLSPLLH